MDFILRLRNISFLFVAFECWLKLGQDNFSQHSNATLYSSRLGDERVGNIATGKDFKTIIPGHWEVYRNGESVKDMNGRAITYSNTDQPGTNGFKYVF